MGASPKCQFRRGCRIADLPGESTPQQLPSCQGLWVSTVDTTDNASPHPPPLAPSLSSALIPSQGTKLASHASVTSIELGITSTGGGLGPHLLISSEEDSKYVGHEKAGRSTSCTGLVRGILILIILGHLLAFVLTFVRVCSSPPEGIPALSARSGRT